MKPKLIRTSFNEINWTKKQEHTGNTFIATMQILNEEWNKNKGLNAKKGGKKWINGKKLKQKLWKRVKTINYNEWK